LESCGYAVRLLAKPFSRWAFPRAVHEILNYPEVIRIPPAN